MKSDQNQLIRKALLIRKAEERLLDLFSEGRLFGTVHTCIGQEWTGVAIANALRAGDTIFSNHRGHGHFIAWTGDLCGLFAEIMGKSTGVCGGYGGSQHLHADGFYSSGIQGGMAPISAGKALAVKTAKKKNIVVLFIGDGTLGEGILYEALNIISKWELPLLVVLENNGYAQSTSSKETLAGSVKGRAEAFGIKYHKSDTWNWSNLIKDALQIVTLVRERQLPAFFEIETYRLKAHSKGDDNRDHQEIETFWLKDSLNQLIEQNQPQVIKILDEIEEEIQKAVSLAENSKTIDFQKTTSLNRNYPNQPPAWSTLSFKKERVVTILYNTFKRHFAENPKLIMIGEDIEAPYGGAFKVTKDLSKLYPGRVRNTPISEAAITGVGTGLALGDLTPIVEIMFGDFLTLAFDQLLQHACKFHLMYNRKVQIPLVIRTPMGGKRGYGPTHSQSLEKHFIGIPNLRILTLNVRLSPTVIYDRLLKSITNPALIIENKILYTRFLHTEDISGFHIEFSDEEFPTVKISPDNHAADVTLLCYGGMLEEIESLIEEIFIEEEILCEVICPTQIFPINLQAIIDSVSQTRKLVVIEEGPTICAYGSEVIAQLAESAVSIDRIKRIGFNSVIPSSGILESNLLPNKEMICAAVKEIMHE